MTVTQRAGQPPNIVLAVGDDHSWHDMGCYGATVVRTPNIDRLAREGMRFERAFTSTAMCAPTRSMLYTGLHPARNGAWPNHSHVYPGVRSLPHYLGPLGYRVALAGKTHIGPAESFPFEYLAGSAEAVGAFLDSAKGRPFCLVYASHNPHSPWRRGLYDPARVVLPPYVVDTPELRQAMADYYFEVTALDEEVGMVMGAIRARGLEEDTLFIYTSEQGAPFFHGKWTCYDVGLRVGFVARWPGRIAAGSTSNAMIHYVDVAPTFVEVAGGEPIPGLDGRGFLDALLGKTDRHRDVVYGVHTTRGIIAGSECYPVRSIRTETHKFIRNLNSTAVFQNTVTENDLDRHWRSCVQKAKADPAAARLVEMYQRRPEEELYDLRVDPWELNNLAPDPAHRELAASLRQRLRDWMREQGDLGIETERKAFERQPRKARKRKNR